VNCEYIRVPRDYDECAMAVLQGHGNSAQARKRLALHPEGSALLDLPLVNPYLQVRNDTLHVLDGGVTKRHLELVGNHLYKTHEDAETGMTGREGMMHLSYFMTYMSFLCSIDPDQRKTASHDPTG
jgi:hypothetical protein